MFCFCTFKMEKSTSAVKTSNRSCKSFLDVLLMKMFYSLIGSILLLWVFASICMYFTKTSMIPIGSWRFNSVPDSCEDFFFLKLKTFCSIFFFFSTFSIHLRYSHCLSCGEYFLWAFINVVTHGNYVA